MAGNVKQYFAQVVQSGSSAPVATILGNSLGVTPSWSRVSSGKYTLSSTGLFDPAKTFIMCQLLNPTTDDVGVFCEINEDAPDEIYFYHQDDGFGLDQDNVSFFVQIIIFG